MLADQVRNFHSILAFTFAQMKDFHGLCTRNVAKTSNTNTGHILPYSILLLLAPTPSSGIFLGKKWYE